MLTLLSKVEKLRRLALISSVYLLLLLALIPGLTDFLSSEFFQWVKIITTKNYFAFVTLPLFRI